MYKQSGLSIRTCTMYVYTHEKAMVVTTGLCNFLVEKVRVAETEVRSLVLQQTVTQGEYPSFWHVSSTYHISHRASS